MARTTTVQVPTAFLVTGGDARPPLRARLREVLAPYRRPLHNALALMIGLWPLWAVVSLLMGLVWVTAMNESP